MPIPFTLRPRQFILLALLVEVLVLVSAVSCATRFFREHALRDSKTLLTTQLNILQKEIELQKDHALDFSSDFYFQLSDEGGRVLWDSNNPHRINTLLPDDHPLFKEIRRQGGQFKPIEFSIPQSDEHFFSLSSHLQNQFYLMGALSINSVQSTVFPLIEKMIELSVLFFGFSLVLLAFFSNYFLNPNRTSYLFQKTHPKDSSHLIEEVLTEHVEIQAYYQAATDTGGNFWGHFENANHLVIYITHSTAARDCFSSLRQLLGELPELAANPSHLLRQANPDHHPMFIASYHFKEKGLHFAGIGNTLAWVLRQGKIEILTHTTLDRFTHLDSNDLFFLSTEGLLEYGKNKAKDLMVELHDSSPKELRAALSESIEEHQNDRPLRSDLLFAMIKARKSAGHVG